MQTIGIHPLLSVVIDSGLTTMTELRTLSLDEVMDLYEVLCVRHENQRRQNAAMERQRESEAKRSRRRK